MGVRLPLVMLCGCAACTPVGDAGSAPQAPLPGSPWKGVETRLIDDGLVNFRVGMTGKPSREALSDYAKCAAAQYAQIRGFGFARHIRTTYSDEGGLHRADAVYTVADALPAGIKTIDAEVTVADCQARGIPTV